MIKKNIFRYLLIMSSLVLLYACSSPAGPHVGLIKYAGTWTSNSSGSELFTIDSSGGISGDKFTANKITQESDNKFVIDATSMGIKGTVIIEFYTDTTAKMSLDFGFYKKDFDATKQ